MCVHLHLCVCVYMHVCVAVCVWGILMGVSLESQHLPKIERVASLRTSYTKESNPPPKLNIF